MIASRYSYSFPLVNSKGHFDLRNETHSYFFKQRNPRHDERPVYAPMLT